MHHGPQHGVHHLGQPRQTLALGQFHARADRRRHRHPAAKQQLIKPEVKQPAQSGRLTLGRHPAIGINPGIEQQALANGAVGQLRGQTAIGSHQSGASQLPLQGDIGIGTGRYRLQHLPGEQP